MLMTVLDLETDVGGIDSPCLAINFKLLDGGQNHHIANMWADTRDNACRLLLFFGKISPNFPTEGPVSARCKEMAKRINAKMKIPGGTMINVARDTKTNRLWLRLPLTADTERDDLFSSLDGVESDEPKF